MPHIDHYWSVRPDMGVPIVKQAMSRNRFKKIKQFFHLADNTNLNAADRFAKVRPITDALNKKFMQFGVFSHNLSIDEQMIPYFGRHSCKMFIKGKPIRFGFKTWCLCSESGYLFSSSLYGGAATPHDKTIGLGAQTVLDLLANVSDPECHIIFFDNFFSSYHLMCLLNERRFFATGTIRENRMGDSPLRNLKKEIRGTFDQLLDHQQEILTVRWNDNAVVNVITNNSTVNPIISTKRYCRKKKQTITIPQPKVIQEYNHGMGGVDLHDNAVANYRICMRGKKWWWPIWTNALGNAMVNAWKLHCMMAKIEKIKPLSQIDFRSKVTTELLNYDKDEDEYENEHGDEGPSNLPRINERVHAVMRSIENKFRRCKFCKKHTIFTCKKCNIHLHTKCFDDYHKNL